MQYPPSAWAEPGITAGGDDRLHVITREQGQQRQLPTLGDSGTRPTIRADADRHRQICQKEAQG